MPIWRLMFPLTVDGFEAALGTPNWAGHDSPKASALHQAWVGRKLFFVYHSGEADTDDERIKVIGPEKLADLIIGAGLVNWLLRKVS